MSRSKLYIFLSLTTFYFLLICLTSFQGLFIASIYKQSVRTIEERPIPEKSSLLTLGFSVQAPTNVSQDLLKYQLASELDSQLKDLFGKSLPEEIYKTFLINSFACHNHSDHLICYVTSYIDLIHDVDLSNQAFFNIFNLLLENPLDHYGILSFLPNNIAIVYKSFGNIQFNYPCSDLYKCDENMFCVMSDVHPKCACNEGFNAMYSNLTGSFHCVLSKLNYVDNCDLDSECNPNSICFGSKCTCKPGYVFIKGACFEYSIASSLVFPCQTNTDCLDINQLMECSASSFCECRFGYHLDGIFCVPGIATINSSCSSIYDCGLNSFCHKDPSTNMTSCKCTTGTVSRNNYDCYPEPVLTRRIPYQFIFQAYPDTIDNLIYVIRFIFDRALFDYYGAENPTEFYEFNVDIFEFILAEDKWLVSAYIDFFEYIQLNSDIYDALFDAIKNEDVLRFSRLSDFTEIGLIEKLAPRVATGHWCFTNAECADPNAECGRDCTQNSAFIANTCRCKLDSFMGINLNDNSFICYKGKELNASCSSNDSIACGANSVCSPLTGRCVCPLGFSVYHNTCVPGTYLLPQKCFMSKNCPPFSRCIAGDCYCYDHYLLENGICIENKNVISMDNSLCLTQSDCGQNSYCSYEDKYCKCLSRFQVDILQNNRSCEPICHF